MSEVVMGRVRSPIKGKVQRSVGQWPAPADCPGDVGFLPPARLPFCPPRHSTISFRRLTKTWPHTDLLIPILTKTTVAAYTHIITFESKPKEWNLCLFKNLCYCCMQNTMNTSWRRFQRGITTATARYFNIKKF